MSQSGTLMELAIHCCFKGVNMELCLGLKEFLFLPWYQQKRLLINCSWDLLELYNLLITGPINCANLAPSLCLFPSTLEQWSKPRGAFNLSKLPTVGPLLDSFLPSHEFRSQLKTIFSRVEIKPSTVEIKPSTKRSTPNAKSKVWDWRFSYCPENV